MKTITLLAALSLIPAAAAAQERTITSRLEIYDVETATRTVLKEYPYSIEAPNWTVDGKALIYNSRGLIYRVDVAAPERDVQIPTGSITGSNNDHMLSADGRGLAISASSAERRGSYIYVLPIEGGEPRLVTPLGPSYLHGWSPDGKWLSYCAERGGNYDVWAIPADGSGPEVRLTVSEGLDDGPEYSPDGRHIWFNSVRSGRMQVWRMGADGSDQRQMTFDEERNSWFPHVSPDGRRVVFIAYDAAEVAPGDHPGGKNVELRLMTALDGCFNGKVNGKCGCNDDGNCNGDGNFNGKGSCCCRDKWSEPETVVKLFGGQGTINVHSWSPDSRRFAFVSYVWN
jgi:Tol biopolymer transport system component